MATNSENFSTEEIGARPKLFCSVIVVAVVNVAVVAVAVVNVAVGVETLNESRNFEDTQQHESSD